MFLYCENGATLAICTHAVHSPQEAILYNTKLQFGSCSRTVAFAAPVKFTQCPKLARVSPQRLLKQAGSRQLKQAGSRQARRQTDRRPVCRATDRSSVEQRN